MDLYVERRSRKERTKQFLSIFCSCIWGIYTVTLAQTLAGLRQVRESVPLHWDTFDTEGWAGVCALVRHVVTGCGDAS